MNIPTILTLLFVGYVLVWWYVIWNNHGRKLQTLDGYIPPAPGFRATKAMAMTSYIGRFVLAGSCTIVGRENIEKVKDWRVMFLPSHVDEADWSVIFPELGRPTRYLASRDQLDGIRKRLAAFTGALAVDNSKKESRGGAREAAVAAMVKDGPRAALTIFMQGKLVRDNVIIIDDFKPGAVRIAKAVVDRTDSLRLAVIPMGIAYVQDENVGRLRRFLNEFGAKVARPKLIVHNVGAVLVIGDPIPVACLSQDEDAAIAALIAAIKKCSDQAKEIAAQKLQERRAKQRVA